MDSSGSSQIAILSDVAAVERLVSHYGTQAALGEHYGVGQSAIGHWLRVGLPPGRRAQVWFDLKRIGIELPEAFLLGPLAQ